MVTARASRQREPARPTVPDPLRAGRAKTAALLSVFVVAYVSLGVASYTRTSATWDEPIHLTAGYAAARQADYRFDPSHPPLLRLWAALPLLFMSGITPPAPPPAGMPPTEWLDTAYSGAHRFLYLENDADRLLYAGRFMVLLLGALLGVLVFFWARDWLGPTAAVAALAFFALEPNLLAHARLVTTDLAVTCFVFGAAYYAWRTQRAVTGWNVAGLALFFSLALATKFTAILLAPCLLLLLVSVVQRGAIVPRQAAAITATVALATFGVLWAAYGFRHAPSDTLGWTFDLHARELAAKAPVLAQLTEWIDGLRLVPNAFIEGTLYSAASLRGMPAFLAGEISPEGWWYYFAFAILIKTPVALLALAAVGLWACVRRRTESGHAALFVLLPLTMFLAVAMISGVNLGVRHVLPIYPFLLLVAAAGTMELWRLSRRAGHAAVAIAISAMLVEGSLAYPYPLTFFNAFVGGPANGHQYLLDSNLNWGQGLKALKAWMDDAGVEHVNLSYFGQADPAYYDIGVTHLPGAPGFATEAIVKPRLPGYVAISETTLHGVYSPPEWQLFYSGFQRLTPAVVIAHGIRVYWVNEWPEADAPSGGTAAHRRLADALLFGLRWPGHAAHHYRAYLETEAHDTVTLTNYGIALAADNEAGNAMNALRQAVNADARNTRARLLLGQLLASQGQPDEAVREFEAVAVLQPGSGEAHEWLRRLGRSPAALSRGTP